ncbi:N-(2-amino-2-carboxyethyl)-L-glutamate synthase [Pseudoalteromonas holothuriae]|uniref:cysteine synthase n=1 Tax=Pseudoalteromonas holothuriae TaxID=2963714 RepID=A0A9W4VR73_9GAMM|nr:MULTISPECIES: 2,3-diaminopropionate biosynthesis protein SbnA [unclassified Pseudoalteromonas]CAH9057866.1 N-(2-amino-2-carboxyethyl)-L-glutamate synthase [Pseudoalteromonas sp. CIP111951]CAH9058818.1 N-(2-amino-2-carboxyethyl)-L-glutamate synthase [Pseudoalteromonas sp. CIP111854]
MSSLKPMIVSKPEQLLVNNLYLELSGLAPAQVHLKYEGFNAAGSIKMKSALTLIDELEQQGKLKPGSEIIESSSGNLGVALAIICASRGYKFTCVTDLACTEQARSAILAAGGNLIVVEQRDANGGFLATRLATIKDKCRNNPNLVWTNQYASSSNVNAHYKYTAPEILSAFKQVDWLFVGAGTTGTLMGCIKYFSEHSANTRIVAIDAKGSITFGHPKGIRHIPGIGTSRVPPICDHSAVKDVHLVAEPNTIAECHYWAKQGFMFGGSTGSVLTGIRHYADRIKASDTVVAISADGGDKYLKSVYNPQWVAERFGSLPEVIPYKNNNTFNDAQTKELDYEF